MLLYFLDDGSLILYDEDNRCQTLFQSDDFDIKRVVGQNYLSGLSGQEAYDFLYKQICENVFLRRIQLCGDKYNHWRKTIYRRR